MFNDVLALKKADISFAMNGATSAAKSVSNIVFLTDDFGVFYDILMEGRRVLITFKGSLTIPNKDILLDCLLNT